MGDIQGLYRDSPGACAFLHLHLLFFFALSLSLSLFLSLSLYIYIECIYAQPRGSTYVSVSGFCGGSQVHGFRRFEFEAGRIWAEFAAGFVHNGSLRKFLGDP